MRYSFVDEVVIDVRSGAGGAGCVGFLREKFLPFGGPNGGNGGRGGDVVIVTDPQLNTLLDFRFTPRQWAGDGAGGSGSMCTGKDGGACLMRVPVGTQLTQLVASEEGGPPAEQALVDLTEPNQRYVVARGGRGGKGNAHFKTSVRQAPDYAQPGEPGEAMQLRLTLKLLANVGLVGMPNVGKSSLLARMSACRPKIADYPFTTLVPNLGVVQFGDDQHFVVADVPGLVVGAHRGTGLGTQFLRHVERVSLIVHVLTADAYGDEDSEALLARYDAIEAEIAAHSPALCDLPRLAVLNRIDLPAVARHAEPLAALLRARQVPLLCTSAASGAGLSNLIKALGQRLYSPRAA